jgi:hypothetical protein
MAVAGCGERAPVLAATSPNGTPVCIMPKGPGFMPSSTTCLRDAP